MTESELMARAMEMRAYSYAPYSQFAVGAALLCADGAVFTGCNVENASYGGAICAERTAAVKAVSAGHREDWLTLAIAGSCDEFCWPCGLCRQFLYEFAPGLIVLAGRGDGGFETARLSNLLPHGFGADTMGSSGPSGGAY